MEESIRIDVAFALPDDQVVVSVILSEGATVLDAIHASGMLEEYPEIDLEKNKVGIYGKLVSLTASVRDRDRIEIYRPLVADPKEVRRRRARNRQI